MTGALGVLLVVFMVLEMSDSYERMSPACDIGEVSHGMEPICTRQRTDGEDQCQKYCLATHSEKHLKTWQCVYGDGRVDDVGECVCGIKCALAFVAGDPHVRSWDGLLTSIQTTCIHTLVKFAPQINTDIPSFELNLQNVKLRENDERSYPHRLFFNIAEWDVRLEFDLDRVLLKVNGRELNTPNYEFRQTDGRRVRFLQIQRENQTAWTVRTSFGIKIEIHMPYANWRDVFFYLPKSAIFEGNVRGALGNMDGVRLNDLTGGNGIQFYPARKIDVERFAATWCVQQTGTAYNKSESDASHEAHMEPCREVPGNRIRIERICAEQLNEGDLGCLTAEERKTATADCFIDTCYALSYDANMISAAGGIREAYAKICLYEDTGRFSVGG